MKAVRSRPRRLAVALVALLAIGAGGGLFLATRGSPPATGCRPADHPEWSVARHWDEVLLDAIRRALPAPTVHARNLFHVSAAMWDAWAAYDRTAVGYVSRERQTAADVAAARNEAISYAAYRVLVARYINSVGADESISALDDLMDSLCYPLDVTTTDGNTPAAVGNRIAAAILARGRTDGSNEQGGYAPPDYHPVNPPLVVASSARPTMTDMA